MKCIIISKYSIYILILFELASLDPLKVASSNRGFLENLLDSVFVLESIDSDSIACDRILSAVLLSVKAILPVASELADLSAQLSSLMERLLTNCGGYIRKVCMDFIISLKEFPLMYLLATVKSTLKLFNPNSVDKQEFYCYLSYSANLYLHYFLQRYSMWGLMDANLLYVCSRNC